MLESEKLSAKHSYTQPSLHQLSLALENTHSPNDKSTSNMFQVWKHRRERDFVGVGEKKLGVLE